MPAHWEQNPTNPNLIWDVNLGQWIAKPANYDLLVRTVIEHPDFGSAVPQAGETQAEAIQRANDQAAVLRQISNPDPKVNTEALVNYVLDSYPDPTPENVLTPGVPGGPVAHPTPGGNGGTYTTADDGFSVQTILTLVVAGLVGWRLFR